jgi:hypothetical protein
MHINTDNDNDKSNLNNVSSRIKRLHIMVSESADHEYDQRTWGTA